METKSIPILLTLAASGICCVISIIQGVTFWVFVLRLAIVAFVFLIIGAIVGMMLLAAFGPPVDEKASKEEEQEEETGEIGDGTVSQSGSEEEADTPEEVLNINTEPESDEDVDSDQQEAEPQEDIDEDIDEDAGEDIDEDYAPEEEGEA